MGHNALRAFPSIPGAPCISSSLASLDLFFVFVLVLVLVVMVALFLLVVVGTRCDSLWKAHGILLLVYMENTREARRACTMQMIPRYGLFIVSHLRVYTRWVCARGSGARARGMCYYVAYRKLSDARHVP